VCFTWGSGGGNMQGRGDDEEDIFAPSAIPEKEAYVHWKVGATPLTVCS